MGNPETSSCAIESDLINRLLRTELTEAEALQRAAEKRQEAPVDLQVTCKYCHFKTTSPLHRNIHEQMHRRKVIRDALHSLGWRTTHNHHEEKTPAPPSGATCILKEMVQRAHKPDRRPRALAPGLHRVGHGLIQKVLPRRMHACRSCGIFFRDALLHRLHMAMHAPGSAPFVCRMCGFRAESALRFFIHLNEADHEVPEGAEMPLSLSEAAAAAVPVQAAEEHATEAVTAVEDAVTEPVSPQVPPMIGASGGGRSREP